MNYSHSLGLRSMRRLQAERIRITLLSRCQSHINVTTSFVSFPMTITVYLPTVSKRAKKSGFSLHEEQKMSCLCLGPKRAGKTHLLKALQDPNGVDFTTYSMPTVGTSIYTIKFPPKPAGSKTVTTSRRKKDIKTSIDVVEVGGGMAPIWHKFFKNVRKIIYVVDTSNLCQISAAGVLLYSILAEPKLKDTKFLLVLTKMDYAYRQMRNEALLMLQMSKLQKEITQSLKIVEVSSVSKDGLDKVYEWLEKS